VVKETRRLVDAVAADKCRRLGAGKLVGDAPGQPALDIKGRPL